MAKFAVCSCTIPRALRVVQSRDKLGLQSWSDWVPPFHLGDSPEVHFLQGNNDNDNNNIVNDFEDDYFIYASSLKNH